jgi:hypothetical protein
MHLLRVSFADRADASSATFGSAASINLPIPATSNSFARKVGRWFLKTKSHLLAPLFLAVQVGHMLHRRLIHVQHLPCLFAVASVLVCTSHSKSNGGC